MNIVQYFPAVRSVIPYAYTINQPNIPGSLRTVLVVKSKDGRFICKFNHRGLAAKNAVVSNSLRGRGIIVPDIKIYNYDEKWFELYRMIPGLTLYEHMGKGLTNADLQYIYHDMVNAFAKMDSINPKILKDMKYRYIHQVAYKNISDTNGQFAGKIASRIIQAMNSYNSDDYGIYHCGMTPKNVILDSDKKFHALLDLDEIAIADRNYAFAMMAAKYQKSGHNIMDLIQYYEEQTGIKLDHKKIKRIVETVNIGKHILYNGAKSR